MGLETATYLNDLNIANPDGGDAKSQGDNHIRMIKETLKNTFPGLAGRYSRVVSKSAGYTVVATDNTVVFDCTADLTLALTAVASIGNGFYFMVRPASGKTVIIDPNGIEQINDATTLTLSGTDVALVLCDGVKWYAMVSRTIPTGMLKGASGAFAAGTAGTDFVEPGTITNFTVPQRSALATDNDLSFNLGAKQNFSCTPTAGGALTFTNIADGQSGWIVLVNGSNYAISAAATTKISAADLTKISTTGSYVLDYRANGTNVYVTVGGAF